MNSGKARLENAARRNGTWDVYEQDFISEELKLFLQVEYSGRTIRGATLCDFVGVANGEISTDRLVFTDHDKAGRIIDVLLARKREF